MQANVRNDNGWKAFGKVAMFIQKRRDLHTSTHNRPAHVCAGLLPAKDGRNNKE
jgi:hypothetical protein